MSTEYIMSSKVIECGSNGRTIPFCQLLLASTAASITNDDEFDKVPPVLISSPYSACQLKYNWHLKRNKEIKHKTLIIRYCITYLSVMS